MAVTARAYPQIQQKLATKAVNLSTDSLKVLLLSAYTYSTSHTTMADVLGAGAEASGTGYVAGGQALTGVTVTTSGQVTTLTANSPAWANSTVTASYAVFYDAAGGSNSTNFPICMWDFGGAQTSSAASFALTVNAAGLVTFTAS